MRARITRRLWFAFLLCINAAPALAQKTVDAALGTRIRVLPDKERNWRVGELEAIKADTVGILLCARCATTYYALNNLSAVQVSTARSQSPRRALLGALVGGLVGFGAGKKGFLGSMGVRFMIDGAESVGGPGDLIFKPRQQWHTFWNASPQALRAIAERYGLRSTQRASPSSSSA